MSFSGRLIIGMVLLYLLFGSGSFVVNILTTVGEFNGLNTPAYFMHISIFGLMLMIAGFYFLFFHNRKSKIRNVVISLIPFGFVLMATQFINLIHQLFIQRLSMEPNYLYIIGNVLLIIMGLIGSYFLYYNAEKSRQI